LEETTTFIVYRYLAGGYRWRLRSSGGPRWPLARGHRDKPGCTREMGLRAPEVGEALVRDATVRGSGKHSRFPGGWPHKTFRGSHQRGLFIRAGQRLVLRTSL
jgi:hypothetical protein